MPAVKQASGIIWVELLVVRAATASAAGVASPNALGSLRGSGLFDLRGSPKRVAGY